MKTTEKVISFARQKAMERGNDNDRAVMEVLAELVLAGSYGACSGFMRLPPGREVQLEIKGQVAIDDMPKQGK